MNVFYIGITANHVSLYCWWLYEAQSVVVVLAFSVSVVLNCAAVSFLLFICWILVWRSPKYIWKRDDDDNNFFEHEIIAYKSQVKVVFPLLELQ